jgi:hypothetical protein
LRPLLEELAKLEGETAGEDRVRDDRRRLLKQHIEHLSAHLAMRNSLAKKKEKGYKLLRECLETSGGLPKKIARKLPEVPKDVVESDGEVTVTAIVSRQELEKCLAQTVGIVRAEVDGTPGKQSPKIKTAMEKIGKKSESFDKLKDAIEVEERLFDHLGMIIELETLLLQYDQIIMERYRDLAMEYHPDRNPGDRVSVERYCEANAASETLLGADKDKREELARDLVFGQQTSLWTEEMQQVSKSIVWTLAPVFASERPLTGVNESCKACKGSGNIVTQGPNDYFPVPLVCEECRGEGVIPAFVTKLRKAIEQVTKKKRK